DHGRVLPEAGANLRRSGPRAPPPPEAESHGGPSAGTVGRPARAGGGAGASERGHRRPLGLARLEESRTRAGVRSPRSTGDASGHGPRPHPAHGGVGVAGDQGSARRAPARGTALTASRGRRRQSQVRSPST